jgi:hypothetical protein
MIFSHVLYQLSYLAQPATFTACSEVSEENQAALAFASSRRKTRAAGAARAIKQSRADAAAADRTGSAFSE